ncbi:Unknown protein sequence [Pseudomonas syringae pv. aceris]|nr:Unknown protein sequence [Pseudomonas syringae pv. aceris]
MLNKDFVTAGLPGDDTSAGFFEDQPSQLRVLDLRGIKRQGNGHSEFAQIRVAMLQSA